MKVQRREATDVLTCDGETAVLLGETALRLSELSAVIYALTEVPVEIERLASELESRFGVPEGSSSLDSTRDAVTELVRRGVLQAAP